MKIVTPVGDTLVNKVGDKEAIRLIKEAGFDGYDYTVSNGAHRIYQEDGLEYAKEIRAYADSIGIPCLQAHAPFGYIGGEADFDKFVSLHTRMLEVCNILGCPLVVIHPANNFSAEDNYKYLYQKLLPLAEKYGVKIATENMWNWRVPGRLTIPAACGTAEDFNAHIDIANSQFMTGCLDIGHAEMPFSPGAEKMIKAMGKNVGALHIHDNNLIDDEHIYPYCGRIDWQPILDALREINYSGVLTFECSSLYSKVPAPLTVPALKFLCEIGKYFASEIEK